MPTKDKKNLKNGKWHHWEIIGKNGKLTAYLDGKKFNGSAGSWIFTDWFSFPTRRKP